MAQQDPVRSHTPISDPWQAFAYLVSGVAFYGLLGWLADRWLGTTFLVAIGILMGAGLGIYLTWSRLRVEEDPAGSRAARRNVTEQEQQQ